jgi:hypothetical protein
MIAVEKNIPMPPPGKPPGNKRYPWSEMNVGDSFAVPASISIDAFRRNHRTRAGRRFKVRKTPDGTYRCWRVE